MAGALSGIRPRRDHNLLKTLREAITLLAAYQKLGLGGCGQAGGWWIV